MSSTPVSNVRETSVEADSGELRGLALWGAVALLVSYAVFIGANFAPVAAGADSGGYYNSARMLIDGQFSTPVRMLEEYPAPSPWIHTPLGFTPEGPLPGLKPTYPVGLPMHYAVASLLGGWTWGILGVNLLGVLAAVVLTYVLLREFEVRVPLALAGAGCLAISPQLLFIAFLPMSDVIATTWCTAAFLGALRARRHVGWALLGGFALGMAVLVRPTNVILGLPLLVLIPNWRALIAFGAGGFPAALWQLFYSRMMYGSAFRTGYGNMSSAFGWEHVGPSWLNYAKSVWFLLPVVLLVPVFVRWLPWKGERRGLLGVLLGAATLVAFYSYYEMTPQYWWYLRFLLPIFPLLILLGLLALQGWVTSRGIGAKPRIWWTTALCVFLVSLATSVYWIRKKHVMLMKPFQVPYLAIGNWAPRHLPADAVIVCMQMSSAQFFYNDLPLVRYDLTPPEVVPELKAALERSGRPVYATILPFEREALFERFPWSWEKVGKVSDVEVYRTPQTPLPR